MTVRYLVALCAAACAAGAAGCATPPADTDTRFGETVRVLNAQQTLDPTASRRNAGVVTKGDGRTVRAAQEQYLDSYRLPALSTVVGDLAATRGVAR